MTIIKAKTDLNHELIRSMIIEMIYNKMKNDWLIYDFNLVQVNGLETGGFIQTHYNILIIVVIG